MSMHDGAGAPQSSPLSSQLCAWASDIKPDPISVHDHHACAPRLQRRCVSMNLPMEKATEKRRSLSRKSCVADEADESRRILPVITP